MRLSPHINFGGRCEAAFHFYERCLGGKIVTILTWGDSPMAKDAPAEWHAKICHATLMVGESELAGVDDPFEPAERPSGFQLLLAIDGAQDAERTFQALADNGTVKLQLQKTFWAARFGIVVDRFGIRWEINWAQNSLHDGR